MNGKTVIKIEQIARMRVSANIKDYKIAELMGITPQRLSIIIGSSEYQECEAAVLQGHVSKLDEALAGKVEEIRKMMDIGVPVAVRTLLEAASQRKDLRAALEASKEILDRHPDAEFAKRSKSVGANAEPNTMLSPSALAGVVTEANKVAQSISSKPSVASLDKNLN